MRRSLASPMGHRMLRRHRRFNAMARFKRAGSGPSALLAGVGDAPDRQAV